MTLEDSGERFLVTKPVEMNKKQKSTTKEVENIVMILLSESFIPSIMNHVA